MVADLLTKSMDLAVTDADLDLLRSYNAELMTRTKNKLANLNTFKVRTPGKS